ncbi:hypothetical protein [Hydrogenoanaerobacterium sp.]|uniref:hypothetical protein n=1 Tax=Hydrogenoanaerobacterium sp. TaxID=2953763 RepID=UPI002896F2A2|nr:hypothetical protein [Hydrogenoanaerobacterium sp.]
MAEANKEEKRKLGRFEEEIMGDVAQICKEVEDEIEAYRTGELGKHEDDTLAETYHIIQSEVSEISVEGTKDFSRKKMELKKKLYVKRDEYNKLIFAEARIKLAEFTKTAEYSAFLRGKVQKLVDSHGCAGAKLCLKADDLKYETELRKICGDALLIEADEQILIGGAKLVNEAKSFISDETLDAALEEQKEWFAANSGFIVTM